MSQPGHPGTDSEWGQATLGTYRKAVHLIQEGLAQLQKAWNALIDWVNGVLDRVRHVLVAKVVTYVAALANRLAEVLSQITELAAEYGDHTGLPGGAWPQAVNR